jgi:hypothetical protein
LMRIFDQARSSESHQAPPLGMLQLPLGLVLPAEPLRFLFPGSGVNAAGLTRFDSCY